MKFTILKGRKSHWDYCKINGERLNKEIRCRTSVVGNFTNPDSYFRLVTAYLIEYAGEWSVFRGFLFQMHSLLLNVD
ncbi:MAG: hypothetical protein GX254_00420 [Clostridiales bacterium]|nr:hypothetical protein [Clostridiales bacterium]